MNREDREGEAWDRARRKLQRLNDLVAEFERLWERPFVRRLCYGVAAAATHASGADTALLLRLLGR